MITLFNAVRSLPLWLKNFILNNLYRIDQSGELYTKQTINGDIEATGYITGLRIGCCGYITQVSDTKINKTDVYTYLNGTLINDPAEGFQSYTNSNDQPCIRYIGTKTMYMQLDAVTVFSLDTTGTTVTYAFKINNDVHQLSKMIMHSKYEEEYYSLSGKAVINLHQYDEIQIVVKADKICNIKTYNFVATINEFFD